MTTKQITSAIVFLSLVIGTAFTIDNRYAHAAEVAKQEKADKDAREAASADLYKKVQQAGREAKLNNLRLEIKLLLGKAKRTADDDQQLAFDRDLVTKLQAQELNE